MSKLLPDEEQPLRLSGELFTDQESDISPRCDKPKATPAFPGAYTIFLHLIIFMLFGFIWFGGFRRTHLTMPKGATWSPAKDFVQYEINGNHALHQNEPSVYAGAPTVEQEKAWDGLLTPTYFAATREEMIQGEESLEDGTTQLSSGGYLATLAVYHELHCLRQLRLYLYRDRYYANITEGQEHYLHQHLDHCIEALRITVMCHGSTALYTFAWTSAEQSKPTSRSNARSVCVNWESIKNWSYSREISEDDPIVMPSPGGCRDCP
ncbi:hypothetical protein F4820DRAFT_415297 [Hypoxylon rubiginosum]|uniref:Uncharacterized protein n=1 Tax=Hypoxylon rubiginosum TaxID=110542 RepID=A0ACB9Z545_9PEZI|nr:hypothetical protein F4820DRAFT_415297 [Hypoxylon rubiginosum]